MTATEFMKSRLLKLNGKEFIRSDVITPAEGFTEGNLTNALTNLAKQKLIVRVGMRGLQTVVYKYKPRNVVKIVRSVSPWEEVWPEFFNAPLIYGKCRANRLE